MGKVGAGLKVEIRVIPDELDLKKNLFGIIFGLSFRKKFYFV